MKRIKEIQYSYAWNVNTWRVELESEENIFTNI